MIYVGFKPCSEARLASQIEIYTQSCTPLPYPILPYPAQYAWQIISSKSWPAPKPSRATSGHVCVCLSSALGVGTGIGKATGAGRREQEQEQRNIIHRQSHHICARLLGLRFAPFNLLPCTTCAAGFVCFSSFCCCCWITAKLHENLIIQVCSMQRAACNGSCCLATAACNICS